MSLRTTITESIKFVAKEIFYGVIHEGISNRVYKRKGPFRSGTNKDGSPNGKFDKTPAQAAGYEKGRKTRTTNIKAKNK